MARAIQGFGAALIAPAALSLVAITFAEERGRDRAVGIFGAVGGVSGSVGVVASGLLAAGPGWRWAFFINVPAGVLFIALAGVSSADSGLASGLVETMREIGGAAGVAAVVTATAAFVHSVHRAGSRRPAFEYQS